MSCGVWTAPVTIFVLVIADPGERKSPVLAVVARPIRDAEEVLLDEWLTWRRILIFRST